MTPRTRRRPWGSITEVTRGKKYILRWTQNTPTGRKRLTRTVYGTYAQANLELERLHVEHADDSPSPTVRRAYEAWVLPTMAAQVENGQLAKSTYTAITGAWRLHVEPRWGDTPVDQLRAVDLQEWLLTLSLGQASNSLWVLSRIYKKAVTMVPLPFNPFAANVEYVLPKRNVKPRPKGVYTLSEALDVLDRLHGHPIEGAFILACFAGLRTGESLGVRLDDVEPFAGTETVYAVAVERQMGACSADVETTLKTAQSYRTAIVLQPAAARFAEILEERRAFGTVWVTDRGNGLPVGKNNLNRWWRDFCRDTGVEHIPWQNLRNSWRTMAETELRMPWDLMELLMGHKLPGMSGAHYIRPSKEQLVCSYRESLRIS